MPPPQNPAQVSGPGALSRRTDGGSAQALRDLPDSRYGENAQFQSLQQGAALSASPGPAGQAEPFDLNNLPPNPAAQQVVPLSAPSQRPNEPVTNGAALGPGAGASAVTSQPMQAAQQDMGKIQQAMPFIQMLANMPDANASTRMFVNLVNGMPGQ